MQQVTFIARTRQAVTFGKEAVLCDEHRLVHHSAIEKVETVATCGPCAFCEILKHHKADCLTCGSDMGFVTPCCKELVCHECDDACPACGRPLFSEKE